MPYENGWTIAHLRLASHGENAIRNTHPFIVGAGDREAGEGEWCIAHNGIWSDYRATKLALSTIVKVSGDTDSEVAAELINLIGPQKFAEEVDYGGVYLCLNKSGDLWTAKTSGDLEAFVRTDKTVLLASKFAYNEFKKKFEVNEGWAHYNKHGKFIKEAIKQPKYPKYFGHTVGGYQSSSSLPGYARGAAASCAGPGCSDGVQTPKQLTGGPNGREWKDYIDAGEDEYMAHWHRTRND